MNLTKDQMESNATEKGGTPILNVEYWTIGKWFSFLVFILMIWTGLYLIGHSGYGFSEPAYEYASFSNTQIRQINHLLSSDAMPVTVPNSVPDAVVPGNLVDSATTISGPVNELNTVNTNPACDLQCRINKILLYINSEYDGKIPPEQLQSIQQYISTFSQQETGVFLADYKFKVRSSFWLAGPLIYAESIFWVIAGVMCSLLFSVAALMSNKGAQHFDNRLIMSQIAKLFYAPFIAIVILLAYNYISKNTSLSSNMGQGIIVFAFIVGFFSGRIMNFLTGFKNLLLPAQQRVMMAPTSTVVTTVPITEPVAVPVQEHSQNEPTASGAVENFAVDENGELNATVKQKRDDGELIDVEVEVKLDTSGLFDDEKNDILKQGFSSAIVTLHNVNGRDIIAAKRVKGKDGIFMAVNVKPGIYIARATLSMKLIEEHIINLFGERTSYLTADKPGFELYIRKYELAD